MNEHRLAEIDLMDLYSRWLEGAGPFACFVRKTNFVSLKHYEDFVLQPVTIRKSHWFKQHQLQLQQSATGQLLLFDIPAVDGMRLACLMQNYLSIKPILTFVSPLHSHGLVGGKSYVNALVGYGLLLKPMEPRSYAFIMDSQRYRSSVNPQVLRRRFNNQYELTAEDLPNAEMLQALGYKQVSLFRQGETKEDSSAYLEYLRDNRIAVEETVWGKE